MSRLLYCWNAFDASMACLNCTVAIPFDLPLLSYDNDTLYSGPIVDENNSYTHRNIIGSS